MTTAKVLALAAACLLPQQPTSSAAHEARGLAHYRAGHFVEAHRELAAAVAAAGNPCPEHLAYDLALAALRVQRTADAEDAIRPLLEGRDEAVRARAEFVAAMAALQRGERAAAAARLPDAEPLAWQSAVRGAELAVRGFLRAADARGTWPEARRNAERASRTLAEFRRSAAEDAAKWRENATEKAPPPPEPPRPTERPPEEIAPDLAAAVLPPAEVARLLLRVQQREAEKQRMRRDAQRASAVAGERDW
ncbi:MAG: hypothetical protein JNK78_18625 [Planctomycetes bacterium]|nr:hypothetical protein [Planctomycetota bacterium]